MGHVTSALNSPTFQRMIALGYVRREVNQPGTVLHLQPESSQAGATIVDLPFSAAAPVAEATV